MLFLVVVGLLYIYQLKCELATDCKWRGWGLKNWIVSDVGTNHRVAHRLQLLYQMCYDKALTVYLRYSLLTESEARLQPEQVKRVLEYWSRILRPGRLGGKLFQESFQLTQKGNMSLFPNTINAERVHCHQNFQSTVFESQGTKNQSRTDTLSI